VLKSCNYDLLTYDMRHRSAGSNLDGWGWNSPVAWWNARVRGRYSPICV